MNDAKWKENVILVDADYIDKVAFNLTVNFERMLERRVQPADFAKWIDCVALDGGLRPADEGQRTASIQVVLLHGKGKRKLDNFTPSRFAEDLDGKAFRDNLGEFLVSCVPVEDMVTADDLFLDSVQVICCSPEVRRVMLVPDSEHIYNKVRESLRHVSDDKRVTVFSMQPMQGGNFRQEILGYSLMAALGIRSEEIK